jgi:transcriptional regulator of acetoin/glycerol metabolism
VLRTASIMAEGEDEIGLEHLPEDFFEDCEPAAIPAATVAPAAEVVGTHQQTSAPGRLQDWQAALIEATLTRLGGNVSAAARELGLARNTVYRHLRKRTTH